MTNSCFDLLWIEMQHGALTYRDVERMIFACKGVPAIPCTRVPEATAGDNQKTTDTGALGIIVPLIDSAAKIEAAVKFRGTRPKAFAVSAEAGTGRFGATTTGRRPTTTS
jgi:2-keto-3-deoxy-L-rhamnonate aldolase RhmA